MPGTEVSTLTGPQLAMAHSVATRFGVPLSYADLIVKTALSVGGQAHHLAAVIAHESKFNPKAQYGYVHGPPGGKPLPGLATGLIQFVPVTAQRLGTTTDAIYWMPFEKQMALVQRYLMMVAAGEWAGDEGGLLDTQEKMALAVFYPRYRNMPPETLLPDRVRASNPGIRTIGDYVDRVMNRTPPGLVRKPDAGPPPSPAAPRAPLEEPKEKDELLPIKLAVGSLIGLGIVLVIMGER